MSLATRCTHCDTIFKVVQDQLKVSEGWVRCGRCNEVFNALEGLFDMDREAPPQRSRPVAPGTAPASTTPEPPAQQPITAGPEADMVSTTESASPPPGAHEPAQAAAAAAAAEPAPAPIDTNLPSPTEPPMAVREPAFFEVGEPDIHREAVTQFDLDLPPSDSAPLPAASARIEPSLGSPQPAQPPAPVAPPPPIATRPVVAAPVPIAPPEALPVTDESDALDSRYLLTTDQAQRPRRRRSRHSGSRGPDFADAQFPADLMADSGWDTDWAASDLTDTASPTLPGGPVTQLAAAERQPSSGSLLNNAAAPDTEPSTLPSRFEEGFRPEQPLPPPSQRKGRSGTRGRLPQPEAPAFIQQAERKAIWRHPLVRSILGVIALLLSVLLAGQAAHHWRDQLASRQPELKPWLAQWCALAHCKISPPLGLDELQVDNITMVKTSSEGDDTYRMTVIIHNKGDLALAWPFVDITLTNPSGEVVARRMFDARTALLVPAGADATASAASAVPPAVPPNASTTLQWQLRAPDLHLASYTAELFYP